MKWVREIQQFDKKKKKKTLKKYSYVKKVDFWPNLQEIFELMVTQLTDCIFRVRCYSYFQPLRVNRFFKTLREKLCCQPLPCISGSYTERVLHVEISQIFKNSDNNGGKFKFQILVFYEQIEIRWSQDFYYRYYYVYCFCCFRGTQATVKKNSAFEG